MTNQRPRSYQLRGGLDLESPAIAIREGALIACANYEAVDGGYRRFTGFERFDGRASPSAARYWVLPFADGELAVAVNDTVTGGTSGATGKVIVAPIITSGTWVGGDAVGTLVLSEVSGTFDDDETLTVSSTTVAQTAGTATESGADTDANDRAWATAAREARRALIAKPAGSGPVRGVRAYAGSMWCVRDNAGATAADLFKATTSGWTAQSFGARLAFTAGTSEYAEGETVSQGGVTATVKRVVVQSGDWAGSDAAGFLVVSGVTGGNFAAGAIAGGGAATASGAQTALTLPAGGKYVFDPHSFTSGAARRLYGANGVGRAFEWDGTTLAPIETGLSDVLDKPTLVAEFKNHLFLLYANGAVLFSEIGEPLLWSTTGGAGEMNFGDEPTDVVKTSSALVIFGKTRISYITGTDAETFQMIPVTADSGASARTVQEVDTAYYFDGASVRKITASDTLGGWAMGGVTPQIERLFRAKREAGVAAVGSYRVRRRNHYVVLFSDKSAVSVYLNAQRAEPMLLAFPFQTYVAWSGDDIDADAIFCGADDGWVYQLDKGRNFDGADISATLITGYISPTNPYQKDRYHTARVGVDANGPVTLALHGDFDFGEQYEPQIVETAFSAVTGGGFWDVSNWDQFFWDGQSIEEASARLDGVGRNVSLTFWHEAGDE